jgi:hypothetical protein
MFVSDLCGVCQETLCTCGVPVNKRFSMSAIEAPPPPQPVPAPPPSCFNCKFSHDGFNAYELFCHRNAPVIVTRFGHNGSQEAKTEWPLIRGNNWCGEHAFK